MKKRPEPEGLGSYGPRFWGAQGLAVALSMGSCEGFAKVLDLGVVRCKRLGLCVVGRGFGLRTSQLANFELLCRRFF